MAEKTNPSRQTTRRNVLRATGAATTGAVALTVGTGNVTAKSGCDDAPTNFPRVTTRGHYDTTWYGSVYATSGTTDTNYDYAGGDIAGVHTEAPSELVIFVHGWNTEDDEALCTFNTAAGAFDAENYPYPVIGYSWDSDYSWGNGKEIAENNGPKLATFLTEYKDANPGTAVRLVGHSLGSRVIVEALTHLTSRGSTDVVDSVSFLGGAVDDHAVAIDEEFGPAIEAAVGTADNFWMEDDGVLNWAYQTYEWSQAIGNNGCNGTPPANYTDHNVAYVDGHSGYHQRDGCIDEVIAAF